MSSKLPTLRLELLTFICLVVAFGGLLRRSDAQAAGYDWLQFGGNAQHSSNNTLETIISTSNVKNLKKLFQVTLPAVVDGPPVYLRAVKTSQGSKDLLFMTTKGGDLL